MTNDLTAANERIKQLEALAARQEDLLSRQQELLDASLKANNETFRWYAQYNQQERANIEWRAEARAKAKAKAQLAKRA